MNKLKLPILILLVSSLLIYIQLSELNVGDPMLFSWLWFRVGSISFIVAIFIINYNILTEIKIIYKRIIFSIFTTIAIILLPIFLIYRFTPLFDFIAFNLVVDNSIPRLCNQYQKIHPDLYNADTLWKTMCE